MDEPPRAYFGSPFHADFNDLRSALVQRPFQFAAKIRRCVHAGAAQTEGLGKAGKIRIAEIGDDGAAVKLLQLIAAHIAERTLVPLSSATIEQSGYHGVQRLTTLGITRAHKNFECAQAENRMCSIETTALMYLIERKFANLQIDEVCFANV